MRVVIAMMKHETNTFSPVPTPLERFATGQPLPYADGDAYEAFKGTGSAMAAFIDLAEAAGAEIVTPIAANAWPSGPVDDDAYQSMADAICAAVAPGCDAVLLDLHGAMVTQSLDDGEGALLARLRRLRQGADRRGPRHAHQSLPGHGRQCRFGRRLSDLPACRHLRDRPRVGQAVVSNAQGRGEADHGLGQSPHAAPRHEAGNGRSSEPRVAGASQRDGESGEALLATLFTGFPHADIRNAGLSAVVATDGDMAKAERLRDELLDTAWREREAFVYQIEPLETSLRRAKALRDGPIILLDHYDNCASGGTMDTMVVLGGILREGLEDVAAFAIHDPAAVQQMIAAGIGATVTLPLGGKIDMPAIGRKGEPLTVTGKVKLISDGRFRNRGPMQAGVLVDMGPTGVLDAGKVEIVVISRHVEPHDLGCLLSVGIDPLAKRYIMLKSRMHFRAGFKPIAKAIIECAGIGVCTSDYSQLTFKNVRRPIYPLDLINDTRLGT